MNKSLNTKKKNKNIKTVRHNKIRTIRYDKNLNKNNKKTVKRTIVPSTTPLKVRKVSNNIFHKLFIQKKKSYGPTINNKLITLMSIPRMDLEDCNIKAAYQLKEPLKIGIPSNPTNQDKICVKYNTTEAKQFLLRNLAGNKHIDPKIIIPPIQSHSNCWFNTMFVTFFVSDKGRKFFHFLRQLMIEGRQRNGTFIPERMQDAFALLNFGIDACLTGNEFAYELNTNSIIHLLFKSIPDKYKKNNAYIVDVDNAGNPLMYYMSIINYLNNSSINLSYIMNTNQDWAKHISDLTKKEEHLPHIIVLEIYENTAAEFKNKPTTFKITKGQTKATYELDSAVIRDISRQHFCATLTCEGKQMGYDGMSFHRLTELDWKTKINTDFNWQFEGTKNTDGTPLLWNFTKSYQQLMYYRVK